MKRNALIAALGLIYSLTISAVEIDSSRLLVKLRIGQTAESAGLGKTAYHLFGQWWTVANQGLELENSLDKNDSVEMVQPNYKSAKRKLPRPLEVKLSEIEKGNGAAFNDPYLSRQWAFQSAAQSGISVIDAYTRRASSKRAEIIVAVVDTGVDVNHEDIPMWKNTKEIPANNFDDDQNGYIDDVYGINTLVRRADGKPSSNIADGHGHGTHVSGTIAGIQNNGKGVAGVATNVKIMGIRTVPNNGDETDADVIESYIYAAKNGAKVINCSFGKAESGIAVQEAIDYVGNNFGVLVVAASGNSSEDIDSNPAYPASFTSSNLLVVASTSSSGGLSSFSNTGATGVDLAAPGSSIISSMPSNRYGNMSGTSMASPHAAGVAAEVLSQFPSLSVSELKDVLMESITPVRSFEGRMIAGGRIDLNRALDKAAAGKP
jgi:thermitase